MPTVAHTMWSSPDGVTWTIVPMPWDTALGTGEAIYWADYTVGSTVVKSLFTAGIPGSFGKGLLASTDGSTWTTPSGQLFSDFASSLRSVPPGTSLSGGTNGIVVSGRNSSVISQQVSTDGSSFSSVTIGSIECIAIGFGSGTWVVGQSAGFGGTAPIFTSPDAVTWTSRTSPFTGGSSINVIRGCGFHSGRFILAGQTTVGTGPAIATSDDGGVTWVVRATITALGGGASIGPGCITYSPTLGRWVVSGFFSGNKVIITSDDNGTTWTLRSYVPSSAPISGSAVVWSPDLGIFCLTLGGPVTATSPDGITWTESPTGIPDGGDTLDLTWSPELGLFFTTGRATVSITTGMFMGASVLQASGVA